MNPSRPDKPKGIPSTATCSNCAHITTAHPVFHYRGRHTDVHHKGTYMYYCGRCRQKARVIFDPDLEFRQKQRISGKDLFKDLPLERGRYLAWLKYFAEILFTFAQPLIFPDDHLYTFYPDFSLNSYEYQYLVDLDNYSRVIRYKGSHELSFEVAPSGFVFRTTYTTNSMYSSHTVIPDLISRGNLRAFWFPEEQESFFRNHCSAREFEIDLYNPRAILFKEIYQNVDGTQSVAIPPYGWGLQHGVGTSSIRERVEMAAKAFPQYKHQYGEQWVRIQKPK